MKTITDKEMETLENMIDKYDIYQVLQKISEVMALKALHIRENWQDEHLAKFWEKQSKKIYNTSLSLK